jgi:hypothetical protein
VGKYANIKKNCSDQKDGEAASAMDHAGAARGLMFGNTSASNQ